MHLAATIRTTHPRIQAALMSLGAVLAYLGLGAVSLSVIPEPGWAMVALNLFTVGMVLAWRTSRRLPAPEHRTVDDRATWLAWTTLVGVFLVGQATGQWADTHLDIARDTAEAYRDARGSSQVALLLQALVMAPMAEEALMRGVIYQQLRRAWGPLVCAVTSSLVFAMLHGTVEHMFYTLPLGLVLAAVYETTRRLAPVVVMHACFNGLALMLAGPVQRLATTPVAMLVGWVLVAWLLANTWSHLSRQWDPRPDRLH